MPAPAEFLRSMSEGASHGPVLRRVMEHRFHLTTADDVRLRCCWSPAVHGAPRGQVLLLQGRAECVEKYHHIVAGLRLRGFDVLTFDWRGQGGSQRLVRGGQGHVADFAEYGRDLAAVTAELERRRRGRLRCIVAHSLGGALILARLCRTREHWDYLWLVAPMLGIDTAPLSWGVARRLTSAMARLGFATCSVPGSARGASHAPRAFEGNPLTSDRGRYQQFAAFLRTHPELGVRGVSFGWINQAARAMEALHRALRETPLIQPMTLFLGGDERVVEPGAIEHAMSYLPQADLLFLAQARHEVMMETPEILDRFWEAVDARLADLSAG